MTDQHPIIPPLELVHQWADMLASRSDQAVFTKAAQWGADQELEACCVWFSADAVSEVIDVVSDLRTTRRPKPLSLKEQALAVLDDCADCLDGAHENTIRRALEALDD